VANNFSSIATPVYSHWFINVLKFVNEYGIQTKMNISKITTENEANGEIENELFFQEKFMSPLQRVST